VAGAYARQEFASGDIVSTNLGFIHDAKVVKLTAAVFRDKTESATPFSGKGFTLGAIAPVGAGEFKLAFSRSGSDAAPQSETKKISIGYVDNLSKRTALYTTYARAKNEGDATTALNSAVTGANRDSSGYDLGDAAPRRSQTSTAPSGASQAPLVKILQLLHQSRVAITARTE